MASLQARGLRFRYSPRDPWLLDGLDLDLNPGRLLLIIGPNGAAKSTLLRLLAGLLSPSEGEVSLDGARLASKPRAELARRIAYAPQSAQVPFDFTAREVTAMARPRAWQGELEGASEVDAALASCDASHLAERVFNELSGGERQRVIAARAFAQSRELLLLDEPTSAQDLAHKFLIMERLRERCDEGGAAAVVSHDLNIAARFADEVLVLEAGRAAARGAPQEVLTSALFERVFGVRGRFEVIEAAPTVLPLGRLS